MADDDNNTGAEATPGPVRKKAAKKKAARKKTTKKVAARAADDSEPTPSEAPRLAQPEPAQQQASAAMHDHGADEEAGISGWLVMWGPLIIVGFLILVFMGDERSVGSMAAAPPPQAEPAAPRQALPAPATTPAVEVTPEQAAADLAEAFKAAGIPLPAKAPTGGGTSGEAAQPGMPPELQGNPWAPATGSAPAVGAAPPPPGYGHPYAGYPYAGGYPPPGYHPYGAPPPGYYGWGPPPGYGAMPQMPPGHMMGPGYMGQGQMGQGYMGQGHMGQGHMGQGYMGQGHMGPGYMGSGQMGPGMMGPGAGYGHPMMQGPAPSDEPEGAPPPPASPSN